MGVFGTDNTLLTPFSGCALSPAPPVVAPSRSTPPLDSLSEPQQSIGAVRSLILLRGRLQCKWVRTLADYPGRLGV